MSIELKDKLVTLESLGVVYQSEVEDRNAAISDEATARAEAISAETAARTEAIANEVTARNAAIVEAINQAETGAPTKVELVSQMTDPDKNYLYIGEEQGYNSGHIYYLVDGAPVDKGVFGGTNIDNTLTIGGQAADAKVTGDKIEEIKEDLSDVDERVKAIEDGESGFGLTDSQKRAILNCFLHVAWTDNKGQTYYDELEDVLFPPAELRRITAVYSNAGDVYPDTSLDDLKPYITVTAHYSNGTTQTVNAYTLSGTLAVGTSAVTVSYSGKNTTINIVVVEKPKSDMTQWSDGVAYTDIEVIEDSYYNQSGRITAYNGWNRTGMIPCDGASRIVFNPRDVGDAIDRSFCWFFDGDKAPLAMFEKPIYGNAITEITIPSDAHFFGLSSDSVSLDAQIEKGFTPYA